MNPFLLLLISSLFIIQAESGCSGYGPDKWQVSENPNHYFQRKNSYSWHEYENGKLTFRYVCKSDNFKRVLLIDHIRKVHIKLDSTRCFYKDSDDKAYSVIYRGTWVDSQITTITTYMTPFPTSSITTDPDPTTSTISITTTDTVTDTDTYN
jgi:hypothetical protein